MRGEVKNQETRISSGLLLIKMHMQLKAQNVKNFELDFDDLIANHVSLFSKIYYSCAVKLFCFFKSESPFHEIEHFGKQKNRMLRAKRIIAGNSSDVYEKIINDTKTTIKTNVIKNIIRTTISIEYLNKTIPVKISFRNGVERIWAYLNSHD